VAPGRCLLREVLDGSDGGRWPARPDDAGRHHLAPGRPGARLRLRDHSLRRDPCRSRRGLCLDRHPIPGPSRWRRRGDHLPERDRRGRRAARRRRPGRLALRQVRRHPAVLFRPGHGRARRRPAGPAAAGARVHRTGDRAGGGSARPRGRVRTGRPGLVPRCRRRARGRARSRPGAAASRRIRGRPGRPGQGRPVRRGGVAGVHGRGAGLGQPVGYRPAGLARRMRGDGAARVRPGGRRASRRRRPEFPAPRLSGGPGRGIHRGYAVFPVPAQRGRGPRGGGQDGQVSGQPRPGQRPAEGVFRGRRPAADP
jgi:hypothetical protein